MSIGIQFFLNHHLCIYPHICGICKKKINEKYTCEKCCNILQYTLKKELCVRKTHSYVDLLISLFQYKDFIRKTILQFKFENKAYIGRMFAEWMSMVASKFQICADYIIPVPIHRKRYKERGYNQSEILSWLIAKSVHIKHNARILKKRKNTVAQSTLNHKKREENVSNAFIINTKVNITGKTILLIDDVYTTGATVNECAKVLKQNGAKKVICLTIAYASAQG